MQLIGTFMTALDMNGFSLSIFPIESTSNGSIPLSYNGSFYLSLLDYHTNASAWQKSSIISNNDIETSTIPFVDNNNNNNNKFDRNIFSFLKTTNQFIEIIQKICAKIVSLESLLTEYDKICGDGDCGLVLKKGAIRVMHDVNNNNIIDLLPAELFDFIANSISNSMGGTSGVLLEIFFRSMSTYFNNNNNINDNKCSVEVVNDNNNIKSVVIIT